MLVSIEDTEPSSAVLTQMSDSCSTSSGCVSDLDISSPDSPISDTSSSMLTKDSLAMSRHADAKAMADDEMDELLEPEELIETEVVIDCSVGDCADQILLVSNCYDVNSEAGEDSLNDRFPTFKSSFDFCPKAETASAKSDSGQESDGTRQSDSSRSDRSVNFRPTKNSVFKDVNFKCLQPKTSRGPLSMSSKASTASDTTASSDTSTAFFCKWTNCDWPGHKDDLVDHIREIHVELQPYHQQKHNWTDQTGHGPTKARPANRATASESKSCADGRKAEASQQYVCLWQGCKVYGKASLSRNWLERHVLEQHSGPRPFKCIVEGCGQRFKVQSALERHVNSHFKPSLDCSNSSCSTDTLCLQSGSNSCDNSCSSGHQLSPFELHLRQTSCATISAVRCVRNGCQGEHPMCQGTPNKILKRKKSTQKVRRKCFYVKSGEDFFDERVMEQVRFGLLRMNDRTGLDVCGNASAITFHSQVIARRQTSKGEVNVLLKWEPSDILPDEWVPEDKLKQLSTKSVPLKSLPSDRLTQLIHGIDRPSGTKQRRK